MTSIDRPIKILRVPRSDEKDNFVILHIKPTAATIELNCEITATESEGGYLLKLKESKAGRFRDAGANQTEDEWKGVLRASLLTDFRDEDRGWLSKIELSSYVNTSSIVVDFRQDVGGIKQKLGQLTIPTDTSGEVEINLWKWLGEVSKEKDEALAKLHASQLATSNGKDDVEQLKNQLKDLNLAKRQHEETLILQCQQLLNEKKRKIREQGAAMARAGVTPSSSGGTGTGKRKAVVEEEEDDDDEGDENEGTNRFEQIEVDASEKSDHDMDDDDQTSDEEEEEVEKMPPPPPPKKKWASKKAEVALTPEEDSSDEEL